jgi:hypothetical protein
MLQLGEITDNIQYLQLLKADAQNIQRDMAVTTDETEATIRKMIDNMGFITHDNGAAMARELLRIYALLGTSPNGEGVVRARKRIKSLFEEMR